MTLRQYLFKKRELPVAIVIEGENGQREAYQLVPAGKNKLGAMLQKVPEMFRECVLARMTRKPTK